MLTIGRRGGDITDWRFIALVSVQFMVLMTYAWLSKPVVDAVTERKSAA
jgi:hypothetical protein